MSGFESFGNYSAYKREAQREEFLKGQRQDRRPSRRTQDFSYLNAADREKWHLKVIADRDHGMSKI